MKNFILKHKLKIISWIIFVPFVLYFMLCQQDYYLDKDIQHFKSTYLTPVLVWTGAIISIAMLLLVLIQTKSIKQSGVSFLATCVTIAFFLFLFQDLFLGISLFINRKFKRDEVQRAYIAGFLAGSKQTKLDLYPYDISAGSSSHDRKLINKLYHPGLNQNDTVFLQFDKGLFGIAYQSQPFTDK